MDIKYKKFIILGAVVLTLIVNYLANALPLNGITTGEISDSFRISFKPADYAFSIWSLIYLGLLGFSIIPLLDKNKNNEIIERTFPWFVASCAANIIWIFVWHYKLVGLSVIVMILLLVALIEVYKIVKSYDKKMSYRERLVYSFPFSLYLGWILVATLVNIAAWLYNIRWDGFGIESSVWSIILISLSAILGFIFILKRRDIIVTTVVLWALIAIGVQSSNNAMVVGSVITASMLLIFIIKYAIYKSLPKFSYRYK